MHRSRPRFVPSLLRLRAAVGLIVVLLGFLGASLRAPALAVNAVALHSSAARVQDGADRKPELTSTSRASARAPVVRPASPKPQHASGGSGALLLANVGSEPDAAPATRWSERRLLALGEERRTAATHAELMVFLN